MVDTFTTHNNCKLMPLWCYFSNLLCNCLDVFYHAKIARLVPVLGKSKIHKTSGNPVLQTNKPPARRSPTISYYYIRPSALLPNRGFYFTNKQKGASL